MSTELPSAPPFDTEAIQDSDAQAGFRWKEFLIVKQLARFVLAITFGCGGAKIGSRQTPRPLSSDARCDSHAQFEIREESWKCDPPVSFPLHCPVGTHEEGDPKSIVECRDDDGVRNGPSVVLSEGKPVEAGCYRQGRRHGNWVTRDEMSGAQSSRLYFNGVDRGVVVETTRGGAPEPNVAVLVSTSTPPGGWFAGWTTKDGFLVIPLDPGSYKLDIRARPHNEVRDVSIADGQLLWIKVDSPARVRFKSQRPRCGSRRIQGHR